MVRVTTSPAPKLRVASFCELPRPHKTGMDIMEPGHARQGATPTCGVCAPEASLSGIYRLADEIQEIGFPYPRTPAELDSLEATLLEESIEKAVRDPEAIRGLRDAK